MTTPYQEGYEQGEWDTENRLCDEMAEMGAEAAALRHIAVVVVEHFGDLAETIRELRGLTPADVDELKRITRDAPVVSLQAGGTDRQKKGTR